MNDEMFFIWLGMAGILLCLTLAGILTTPSMFERHSLAYTICQLRETQEKLEQSPISHVSSNWGVTTTQHHLELNPQIGLAHEQTRLLALVDRHLSRRLIKRRGFYSDWRQVAEQAGYDPDRIDRIRLQETFLLIVLVVLAPLIGTGLALIVLPLLSK